MISRSLKETLAILALAAGVALIFNALRETPLEWIGSRTSSAPGQAVSPGAPPEMPFEKALAGFEAGSVLFVDARSAEAYTEGHIQGAVSFPDQRFDELIVPFLEKIDPKTVLVTYCEGEACHLSTSLAEKLMLAGFENVFHLRDGWGRWKKGGLPSETGQ